MASHDEVAHNWAHQTGRKKNGFNMYYDGETIYSYGSHFPIASFVQDKDETRVVFFNCNGYSVSTAKHKTITSRAIPAGVPIFDVPCVTRGSAHQADYHRENYESYRERVADALGKASRARKWKDFHLENAQSLVNQANDYCARFDVDAAPLVMPDDIKAYLVELEERKAKEEAERRAAALKAQQEREAKEREALKEWLSGADVRPPHTSRPYVRVVLSELAKPGRGTGVGFPEPTLDQHRVETSWGVRVPLRKALAAYRLARICKAKGVSFTPRSKHTFDGFALDKIASDGTLRAGCHVIPFAIQHAAAKQAGLA